MIYKCPFCNSIFDCESLYSSREYRRCICSSDIIYTDFYFPSLSISINKDDVSHLLSIDFSKNCTILNLGIKRLVFDFILPPEKIINIKNVINYL